MMSTSIGALNCSAGAIPAPILAGAEILAVATTLVRNYTHDVSDQYYYNHPSISVTGIDFCNITVTYTHTGKNDTLNVESWLPMNNYNGRLQAVGGGGWVAGRFPLSYIAMAGAIGNGYAASTTDGGVGTSYVPDTWAQSEPGVVDYVALENFATTSLGDQAILAKGLIKSFYGRQPEYSYWSGCSQGGRQGYVLAQNYPDAYDGIAAAAPAINWPQFFTAAAWAQVQMNLAREFPVRCELNAITEAAIAECDPLDGISDGLVSNPDLCSFDPFSMVGDAIYCADTESTVTISNATAAIANATWTGPRDLDGGFLWYGPDSAARLTGADTVVGTSDLGYAMTTCSKNGTCVGNPTLLGEDWLKFFVNKDPSWDYTKISSVQEYNDLFHASSSEYISMIGSANPDLSAFRDKGGKLLTYHGLADGLIPSKGTRDYYDRVVKVTSNVSDFYRFFEVPGLGHCAGGIGGQPTATWQALVDWVENGKAPDVLPITTNTTSAINDRILCPYPQKAHPRSCHTNSTGADAFVCA